MAPKKNYSRFFIILQEEERGYTLDRDKTPSGYVKLEKNHGKCKISYYAQNINPKMQPYYMALICSNKDNKKIINLGKLNFDDNGKVEISFDYDVTDIANTKMSMEDIVGAAIIKTMDNTVLCVMSGFNASEVPKTWQNFEMIKSQKEERTISESNIFEIYEESIESIKSKNRVEKSDQELKESADEIKGLKEQIEDIKNGVENDASLERNDLKDEFLSKDCDLEFVEEASKVSEMDTNESDNNTSRVSPVGVLGDYFRGIVGSFDEFEDIGNEVSNCKWNKVRVDSMETLYDMTDVEKHAILYYPMACYYSYIEKHGHFLFGMKSDKEGKLKYLVYGIPGSKKKEDQPFEGKTGFVTWIPSVKDKEKGHWIMFYDFKNCNVVIPIKK